MELDNYQKEAAHSNEEHSFIIAAAGSGKTTTLVERIEYLISQKKMSTKDIIVLSFTNETVNDFKRKLNARNLNVKVFTFHKLALEILKEEEFSLFTDFDEKYILKEFFENICFSSIYIRKLILRYFYKLSFHSKKDFQTLLNSIDFSNLCNLMIRYYSLSKTQKQKFILPKVSNVLFRKKIFYYLMYLFFQIIELEKKSSCMKDFEDLIYDATKALICKKYISNFKHILVDEFQDTSKNRLEFLTALIFSNHSEFTLVGDDFQSIYRFTGTNQREIKNFLNQFPNLKTYYLKNTYRNSQELNDIAGQFVLKNPYQNRKEICSFKHLEYPIEILFHHNYQQSIFKILQYILKFGYQDILVLGRNSFDYQYYFRKEDLFWQDQSHFIWKKTPNVLYHYLTVHKAKGLEAEAVIILHLSNDEFGFPSNKKENPLILSVLDKELYPNEEERRLFYVALTRTKTKVFLLTPLANPSIFVIEILRNHKKGLKKLFFNLLLFFYCAY